MKIGVVAKRWSTHGGTERFMAGFVRWLLARDHEVTLHCQRVEMPVDGVGVVPLPDWGPRLWRGFNAQRSTRKVAGYDVVFGFSRMLGHDIYRAGGGCHAAWLGARGGRRLGDAWEVRLDRAAIAAAGQVVVNSEMAEQDLVRLYGIPASKIQLIRNGVDLERFHPEHPVVEGLPSGAVVFLGTGFARKGLAVAMQALAPLSGVPLVVVGREAHLRRYQKLAVRLGMEDRVHWLGPRTDPEAILPSMKALILPTIYDPFANATLEALASGIPVITSKRNGAGEVVPEPWMVAGEAHDVTAFTRGVEQALQSSGEWLRQRCRSAAEVLPDHGAYQALFSLAQT